MNFRCLAGRLVMLWILCFIYHDVSIAAISSTSQQLDEFSFKKGLTASGGLTFSNAFYRGNDSLVVRDPYAMSLSGSADFNLWGISLPFSFAYSNTQKTYTQPFNRFSLNPSYKWVHLLVGTNVVQLSPYTLGDHEVNGVGVVLTPGRWNVSGIYGRLQKAVEYDPLHNNFATVAYKRMGYAAKVGYRAEHGEYDVTLFHGEDEKNSIGYIPSQCYLTPQENTAFSVSVKQNFLKYFFVQGGYAASVFNTNTMAEIAEDTVTEKNLGERLLDKKPAEHFSQAFDAALGYQGKLWGLALKYNRVDPNYSSLGCYHVVNDMENYTVAPNLRLLKGKLTFSGNFGIQYNNLNGKALNNTRRTIYSANAAFNSGKAWNASLGFSNFTTYTKVKPQSYPFLTDNMDTLNFYQISRSLTAGTSYSFKKGTAANAINLSATYQQSDFLKEDQNSTTSDVYSGNLVYSSQVEPLELGWSASVNGNYCSSSVLETIYLGPAASVSKSFFKKALSTGLSCAYNLNRVSGRDPGSLVNANLAATYSLGKDKAKVGNHSLSLSSGFTRYLGGMAGAAKNYEFLTSLTYDIHF